MGCDIHVYTEAKNNSRVSLDDQPWEMGEEISVDRSYGLFGLMAGVRIPDLCMYPPRGLPEGLSMGVLERATVPYIEENNYNRKIYTLGLSYFRQIHPDWHTFSWLKPSELLLVLKRHREEHDEMEKEELERGRPEWLSEGEIEANPKLYLPRIENWKESLKYHKPSSLLQSWAEYSHDDRDRIVFWFDN